MCPWRPAHLFYSARGNCGPMRIMYQPSITCPACGTEIKFNMSPQGPQHLHLKKTSFVSPCPNTRCKRLATADPGKVKWTEVDLDDISQEGLPF